MANYAIDLSNLPGLLAALPFGLQLALVTSDGVTWTAALVQQGQPAYVYSATGADPGSATVALLASISGQASIVATSAAVVATAIATAVRPSAVQPGGAVK
jgi:hypothetical protein